jgi:DNA-directed RNA polymerase beta subunit/intein/homing endonuclease
MTNIPSYRHILETFITQSDGKQIISHQIESFNQFMEVDIPEIIHMANPITSYGSPEIPLAGPRSALATATGLSTTAANALMGTSADGAFALGKKVQHEYEVTLEFEEISIRKPTIFENNGAIHPMMPNDARLRNLTYASPLNVNVKVITTFIDNTRNGIRESNVRIFPNVHLGKIPVMVGSKYCLLNDQKHIHPSNLGECTHDVGGYFIIQGGERVMISMERMSENRPFVFRNGRGNAKDMEIVEIKCIGPDNDQVPKSNTVKIVYHPKNQLIMMLRATVPRIKTDIPIVILFRALGVLADKDIYELIVGYENDPTYDHIITESILEAGPIITQEMALHWLVEHTNSWSVKSQKQNNVQDILSEELFPQIGGYEMNYEKACFLAHMTRKVLWTSTQRIPTDDRDAYPNKRVDIPGFLIADLFRKTYNNRMVKDMKGALSKEIHGGSWKATGNWTEIININNINKIIKSTILDVCLKSSLATGKFGSGKIGGPSKDGVSQVLNRLNYTSVISHLRRISTPIEKTGKLIAPRKQHNSQWGYICVKSDTAILHGNGMTSSHIIKLKDGDIVRTVNPNTLEESPSAIHHYFKTTPESVLEIKTLSGRVVGCSPDHPLLVVRDGNEWVHAGDLVVGDKVIVKNYTVPLSEEDGTEELIGYSEKKKQILARLLGASLSTISCLEKVDAEAIAFDIAEFGLPKPTIHYFKPYYSLDFPQFSSKYHILFNHEETIPSWILNGSSSVKREFVSAFLSVGFYSKQLPEVIQMLNELGINASINDNQISYQTTFEEIAKYASVIGYRYCIKKSRENALLTEYSMYRDINGPLTIEEFSQMTSQIDDKIIMPITEIKKVAVEDVYDFTTESENHDFYANGILVRNCPCETPEGHGVGVIKNMASTTSISIFSSPITIYAFIQNLDKLIKLRDTTIQQKHDCTRVFLNGAWIGMLLSNDAADVVYALKNAKRSGRIHIHTGIIWKNHFKELWITTEAGRVLRPVYYAPAIREMTTNSSLKQQILDIKEWNNLLIWESPTGKHLFEYLDAGETECSYIAMDYESCVKDTSYTHCEIHPSVIFGTAASGIPFPDHNQSPRNAYQCLSVNETVRMANGTDKCIADVKIGDEVITFHPETHTTTIAKVCNHYIRDTDKPMFQLQISGNRTVVATGDHRFMTCHGPLRVDEIDVNKHMIGIYTEPSPISIAVERTLILDEDMLRKAAADSGIHDSMINSHVQTLKTSNLLPLYSDDTSVPILARIAGFASTDGSLNVYIKSHIVANKTYTYSAPQFQAHFGTKSCAEALEEDVIQLRLPSVKVRESNRIVDGRKRHTWFVQHGGPLPTILIALGVGMGKKTETSRNPIPTWIMKGSLMTKREFLGGFQGGDGCRLYANLQGNTVTFRCGETSQQASADSKDALHSYMSQIVTLFNELGVTAYMKEDKVLSEDRTRIRFNLNAGRQNLLHFYDTIGYRYDHHKTATSAIIAEFIRESGINTISPVALWTTWLHHTRCIGNTVFIPIRTIVPCASSKVADITVYNDNHTFITSHSIESMNCAMSKQAMGIYALNFRERFDAMSHVLCYPEIPMVSPYMSKFYGAQNLPSGQNIIVAIMTYTGYNQEDSNMINRAALDRGRFRSIFYRTYKDEERKNQSSGEEEKFCTPDPVETKHMKNADYNKIVEDGFVPKDTYVTPDDVLIGKVVPLRVPTGAILPAGAKKQRDVSKMPRNNESGYVDKIYKNRNGEGYSFVKIRMRQDRIPEIGDKFSCYSPDTDILTMRGWIPFPELTLDDKVATLVNETTMTYTTPLEVMSYDYKGKMYKVDSNQVDLLVTPNHRMYVGNRSGENFGFKLAEECYSKRWTYKKNIENYVPLQSDELSYLHNGEEMKEPQGFILKGDDKTDDLIIPINDWLMLFGIWIAEGCTLRSWGVSFATHKQRVKDVLEPLCARIGFEIRKHKDDKDDMIRNAWCMIDRQFVDYIKPLSVGSVNKSLPAWTWSLTPEQCRTLINGMMLGDGHTMANGTRRYDTSSIKLANDFQRLCLHAGYSANIILKYAAGHEAVVKQAGREGEVIRSTVDAFRLTIIEKQNTPLVNKNITAKGENRHDSWEEYDGKVYCCKVEGPGAIYVRRNKMPVWSGNSRHGQKGTMGMILNPEDMPQTASGIVPDIIINPHAIPSRMTIAQLMETLLSKIGCMTGCLGDGSPFNATTVEDLAAILRDTYGMEPYGNEIMYNGYTGRMMETSIFIGPCYYQRLRHCSADKLHSRASGPLVMLTRQPAEGRAREGGLRFGEMERDCVVAHGMAEFTKERLMECSDAFSCYTCKDCGLLAIANPEQSIWACRGCSNSTNFSHINIPYATKLLLQELETMCIGSRLITEHKLINNTK